MGGLGSGEVGPGISSLSKVAISEVAKQLRGGYKALVILIVDLFVGSERL